MQKNKMFTIAICAYNAENRIRKTINSVLNLNNYMEFVEKILLVDNNSKDRTKEIMQEFVEENENFEYIFEHRQGLSYARLAAVLNTSSEWMIFIDDDNILQNEWIIEANKYIQIKNKVGVFNGAVVPLIEEKLNDNQKNILEYSYKMLACTHLNEKEIDILEESHPLKEPIGAGMVVKTEVLKKLANEGWTKLSDRKGDKLSSGGDTEIARYVKAQGYEYGYNPNMLIHHFIHLNRLKELYILRLIEESIEGEIFLSKEKFQNDAKTIFALGIKMFIKFVFSKITLTEKSRLNWKIKFYQNYVLFRAFLKSRKS